MSNQIKKVEKLLGYEEPQWVEGDKGFFITYGDYTGMVQMNAIIIYAEKWSWRVFKQLGPMEHQFCCDGDGPSKKEALQKCREAIEKFYYKTE